MIIWLLLGVFCIALWSAQSANNEVTQPYTYYFESHRYSFEFDFGFKLNNDMDINILFSNNTSSSYILNINHNTSLHYGDRRRLYETAKRKGRFIGVAHARQFHDAERVCRHRYGGELASIKNSNENKQILKLCKSLSSKSNCWIGLRRPFRHWTDGGNVNYKHWNPGEPNNAGRHESCTEMYRNGRWNDNRCRRTRPFICETATITHDKSYVAVGMALSWDNANEYCHRRFETELATVRSDTTNKAIRRLCDKVARKGSCWIGLERPFKKWQNRKRVTYTQWNPGEPNNWGSGESCTEIYSNKRWNDLACRNGRFFVCNYKGTDNRNGKRRTTTRRRSKWIRGTTKHRKVSKEADRRTLHMECSRGRIETISASYGRNCKSSNYNNQIGTLRSACNGKSRCQYRIDLNKIGDPARGCSKEYEYKYRCKWRRKKKRKRRKRRRRRKRWRARLRRWKCSRLRFDDYERKECLRRRSGTIRRYTRGRQRKRWRKRLGQWAARMRSRGYRGFSGMGRGFRRGFEAGKRSVRSVGNAIGNGLNAIGGAVGNVIPRIKMTQYKGGRIPLPPRIKLIDLPRHRRRSGYSSRRLGTGYNIGITGHHKKYGFSNYAIQAALAEGATMNQLKQAAKFTDKLLKKEAKEDGFYGFHGFDGFGSGRLNQDKRNQNKQLIQHPEALTFGIGEKIRRILIDKDDKKNGIKCVMYYHGGVYQICGGHDFVWVKKLVKMIQRVLVDDEAMINGLKQNDYIYYLNVYQFSYNANGNEECFNYLRFVICFNMNDENDMMLYIENGYSFNFSNDNEWSEIDSIIENGAASIQKCVHLLETKMCIHCDNNLRFKLLIFDAQN